MVIFFLGGVVGFFIGGWVYVLGGWNLILWIGIVFLIIVLFYFVREE